MIGSLLLCLFLTWTVAGSEWLTSFPMALPAYSGPRFLIRFRNHLSQTVGLIGRVISPSQGRYLNTGKYKHRINTDTKHPCPE
jgi:hypothetical protein